MTSGHAQDAAVAELKDEQACNATKWTEWVDEALSQGGSKAFHWIREPQQWKPEVVDAGCHIGADPSDYIKAECDTWSELWQATSEPAEPSNQGVDSVRKLMKLAPAAIRNASSAAEVPALVLQPSHAHTERIKVDCAGVVSSWMHWYAWAAGPAKLAASVWRGTAAFFDDSIQAEKVKAHRCQRDAENDDEKSDIIGNSIADKFAKKGAAFHNVPLKDLAIYYRENFQ